MQERKAGLRASEVGEGPRVPGRPLAPPAPSSGGQCLRLLSPLPPPMHWSSAALLPSKRKELRSWQSGESSADYFGEFSLTLSIDLNLFFPNLVR